MKNLLLITGFITLFVSCDYIHSDEVFKQRAQPSNKKVLLEIFTGWKCPNCPSNTAEGLNRIKSSGLEKNTIIIKIHDKGFFSAPSPKFTDNFKTPEGAELQDRFKVVGFPIGVVSRKSTDGSYLKSPGTWAEYVEKVSNDENYAPVELEITLDYSEVSRGLSVKVNNYLSRDISKSINLLAYITEDSIIQPQIDNEFEGELNLKFAHRHVLRGQLAGRGGNILLTQGLKNENVRKTFEKFILPVKWNDKQCSVVAVAIDAKTGEVVQVEEAKVVE